MNKAKLIIFISLLNMAQPCFSHSPEEGKVHATLGPFIYRTYTSRDTPSDIYRYGGGIIAEADVDKNGGVEIAMIYLDKLYYRKKQHHLLVEKIKRMYITTGYRHWFNPNVSAALAFFSSYSMGDAVIVEGAREDHNTFGTSARKITEYGFDFSLQWEVWSTENFGIVADARYSQSTSNKSNEEANVYGAMLGIKYLIPKMRSEKDLQ